MTQLRLYAIGIDEVRDMFGASPELADTLRRIAAARFVLDKKASRVGMLGKLGPLFAKPPIPADLGELDPTTADVETILAGRFIAPERVRASWRLIDAWVGELGWGTLRIDADPAALTQVDFDLARADVNSEFGLESLFRGDLGLPLRPLPDMRIGYRKHAHARAMADALRGDIDGLADASRDLTVAIQQWLANFPAWAEDAFAAGRAAPDVVATSFA